MREHSAELKTLALRQCVGTRDTLLEVNRRMHGLFTEAGFPHEYEELPEVGHNPREVWTALGVKGWAFSARHFQTP